MRYLLFLFPFFTISLLLNACGGTSGESSKTQLSEKEAYIRQLEKENNISYEQIKNTRALYIPPMCFTKRIDEKTGNISNPCYSCHTKGRIPNYINDADLQGTYNFPLEAKKNPYLNLFKNRTKEVEKISDKEILNYVRKSNYLDENGNIILAYSLPKDWEGYRPDCYFNFDEEGFDRNPKTGEYTLWRAFRYYPFLGTFWPTNGSTDDVLIRLAPIFAQDENGKFNLDIYKLNLSIVEAVVKQKNIKLSKQVDERKYGVDLNQNGKLDMANEIVVTSNDKMSYVGKARQALLEGKIHLALGLYPEGTEFLHSVRYIDWEEKAGHATIAKRMKELRYSKKYEWKTYSELEQIAQNELQEQLTGIDDEIPLEVWQGDYEHGLKTGTGWVYQGFIEDKNGNLRPQTHEETIKCMGCHAGIGATTDTTFSFPRKLEGIDKNTVDYGWGHWTQKGFEGVKEPKARYKNYGLQYEYSFYLKNNHSANEFRDNDEVERKFFNYDGSIKEDMLEKLHNDISILLLPSKERALMLDKAYKVIVNEQSYIYGSVPHIKPMKNVYKEIEPGTPTNIEEIIVRDYKKGEGIVE